MFCKTLENNNKRAVGMKGKYWTVSTLKVLFLEGTQTQKDFVKSVCVKWEKYANIKFVFVDSGDSDIRIAFKNDGAWSYIGTDCKNIPQSKPTMNLGWLDEGVVLHEFGHALGLAHEHQNPTKPIQWNRDKVIKDLSGLPNNWSVSMIENNVLNRIPISQVDATDIDKLSIMEYPIPASWTLDGFTAGNNQELSEVDKKFIATIYPFKETPPSPPSGCLPLKNIFKTVKEINTLPASTVLRWANELKLNLTGKMTKSKISEMIFKALTLLFILFSLSLHSQDLGLVRAVHDGDSYKIEYPDTILWVRLAYVDCPEVISNHISKNQAFGVEAGNFARNFLKYELVETDSVGTDIYNRRVSTVKLDSVDMAELLLMKGYAWFINSPQLSKKRTKFLKSLEKNARKNKIGIWSQPYIKPSTFRKRNQK